MKLLRNDACLLWVCILACMPCQAAASTPSSAPEILSIASLRTWVGPDGEKVSVRGVVTRTGVDTFLQDPTGGVLVHLSQPTRIRVGDELEVQGVPFPLRYSARLEDASARVLWATVPPPPIAITADQAARGDFDALFVELDARLDEVRASGTGPVLLSLSNDRQRFYAVLPRTGGDLNTTKWEKHSMVRVRGICIMDPAMARDEVPFLVLLRSSDDAEQLAGPPWWSPQLLLRDVLVLTCVALVFALVIARIRTDRARAVQEEREHIAHEMHDTMAQSFAGVAFQLQAVRAGLPAGAGALASNVDVAINMVRHSHQEARQSIATLRAHVSDPIVLEKALVLSLRRMVDRSSVQIDSEVTGSAVPLPLRVASALLRIGQEAGANAIAHTMADLLTVRLRYEPDSITLEVQDNGAGFDPSVVSGSGLGLIGMADRALKLSGSVDVLTDPGKGTLVRARIPLRKQLPWQSHRKQ